MYEVALESATDALKTEGFGVLTTIDVQHTLRAKLNRNPQVRHSRRL